MKNKNICKNCGKAKSNHFPSIIYKTRGVNKGQIKRSYLWCYDGNLKFEEWEEELALTKEVCKNCNKEKEEHIHSLRFKMKGKNKGEIRTERFWCPTPKYKTDKKEQWELA